MEPVSDSAILASSMDTKPMAIVVSEFVTKDSVEYGLIATAGIVSLIPPAVTALFSESI